ncbi:RHS repeat-associated core domain-containing protein [Pseudomonas sp. BJa3]|uniref:RHS repeat-associated core domain-containing protein n=1 Tax=Pseudomonas sp. BJa3 TaxID=2986525 RepID=UPI002265C385|nr:RHS repeat-associated core domain-containing protein [Pseudomonas sp. BJa3]MCX5507234.1 RHS repeat-associated core domain-containing protein [Pseudomonas sp. BJa3]
MQIRKLLASDHLQSVLFAQSGMDKTDIQYSPYGQREVPATPRTGFTGQHCEVDVGWYFLGNGYRVYNPVIMRFHSPDLGYSPFGRAGVNSYAYVTGNPIGLRDPSGCYGEGLTAISSEGYLSGATAERIFSYAVNSVGVIAPLALWTEMARRGVPVSGWTKVAFLASIGSGAVGTVAQFLSDNGFEHPSLPYAKAGAAFLTFVSVVAGGVQAHEDNRAFGKNQQSPAENMRLHVISPAPPTAGEMPPVPQKRARRRSPTPEPLLSIQSESPPRTPPAGPKRYSRGDLGRLTRFGFPSIKK